MKETVTKPLYFETADAWEAWLMQHALQHEGIDLLIYKKHTNTPCVTYEEAVEAALCYGWIDGTMHRIDDTKHTIYFSPRRKNSIWSKKNKEHAKRLIDTGRMTPQGMRKVEEAKENGKWDEAEINEESLPDLLRTALEQHPDALHCYNELPNSAKKQYHWWIIEAKREATKLKRVEKAIAKLQKGLRLWEEES